MPGLMRHGKCTPNHSEPVVTYEIKILGFADLNAKPYPGFGGQITKATPILAHPATIQLQAKMKGLRPLVPGLMRHWGCTPTHSEPVVTSQIKILGFTDLSSEAYLSFGGQITNKIPFWPIPPVSYDLTPNEGFEAFSARVDAAREVHSKPLRTRSYI